MQFATDTATGLVVGVDVTNAGSDGEEMSPMLDQLKTRYDIVPDEMLVDGGFGPGCDRYDRGARLQGLRPGKGHGEAEEGG